ncbi:MAG: hypothetical protein ACRCXB_09890 [Aeromonadaceae bacterium]
MIDLNEIESEVGSGNDDEMLMFTRGEMLELITRLRQAEKDAARYRWLKEHGRHDYDVDDFFDGSCDRIDAKVDEAMNASNN